MEQEIILRDYIVSDFPQVNSLWTITGMGGKARGDNDVTIRNCNEAGGRLIVLEDRDKNLIIGTSWLTHDSRRLYLHHFGILPEYQGRGLSHRLLKESLQFAKEKRMQIKIEVHRSNEIALSLYKNSGFEYLGDYNVYIIRDLDKVIIKS